jgi:hypothetical protein
MMCVGYDLCHRGGSRRSLTTLPLGMYRGASDLQAIGHGYRMAQPELWSESHTQASLVMLVRRALAPAKECMCGFGARGPRAPR